MKNVNQKLNRSFIQACRLVSEVQSGIALQLVPEKEGERLYSQLKEYWEGVEEFYTKKYKDCFFVYPRVLRDIWWTAQEETERYFPLPKERIQAALDRKPGEYWGMSWEELLQAVRS